MKKYIILLILIIGTFPLTLKASPACLLKKMRVQKTYESKDYQTKYYELSNLGRVITIPIKDEDDQQELSKALLKSEENKDLFINLTILNELCDPKTHLPTFIGELMPANYIQSIAFVNPKGVDCIECTQFKNLPISLNLPASESELEKLLAISAGLNPKKVKQVTSMIRNMFDRMNFQKTGANNLVFVFGLFKALEFLDVKSINHDQLEYLTSAFGKELDPTQLASLRYSIRDIKELTFSRESNEKSSVKLTTLSGENIHLKGKDLPTSDKDTHKKMETYFEDINIVNNASLTFEVSSHLGDDLDNQAFIASSKVNLSGIKIIGKYPILGAIWITPSTLEINIDDKTPVKAKVSFKKGPFELSHQFNLDE